MNLFRSLDKRKRPSYVLTTRLPAEIGPKLLGRIVEDFNDPTDGYRPEDPTGALSSTPLSITDSDFKSLFSKTKDSSAEIKVAALLGLSVGSDSEQKKTVNSTRVQTFFLTQHRDALARLLEVHRAEILNLLTLTRDRTGYMIVGFKVAFDADHSTSQTGARHTTVKLEFPVREAALAASHGAADVGEGQGVGLHGEVSASETSKLSFSGQGEQIFAIRYRILKLRKAGGNVHVDYGQVKRVDRNDGVFGDGPEDGSTMFDEEYEDADEWDDADLVMSNESVKGAAERLNRETDTLRFND